MQATSLTGACATVAVVLGVIGLYLDSPAAVAGAMGLTGLLCGQGVLFMYRTARFADDLQVERVIETTAGLPGDPRRGQASGDGTDPSPAFRSG